MKKLFLVAVIAIAGWLNSQAQSKPAPERYNQLLEQMVSLEQNKAEFLMNATMETLSKDPMGYRQMMELAEKRFSDPADAIHNEGLYLAVLKHTTENFILSNAEKEKQRLLLMGAKKNMIGAIATDFDYVTNGDKAVHHLKDLNAGNILIYFNNPDCESCETVKERLANSELINRLVNEKKLIVLGIYPYEDGKLWKKSKYPSMMINGWNQSRSIEQNELYDLPTLPCFYLLDNNYKVLIKNEGSLNKVEAKLKELLTANAAGPNPLPAPQFQNPQVKNTVSPNKQKQSKQEKKITPPGTTNKKKHPRLFDIYPASKDDPNTIRCEEVLNHFIKNEYEDLYKLLNDDLKAKSNAKEMDGALAKSEQMLGKYQSHDAWELHKFHDYKTYAAILHYEKGDAGIMIIFENDGKIKAMSFVPEDVILNMRPYTE